MSASTPLQRLKLAQRIKTDPLLPTESQEQMAVFEWAALKASKIPELRMLFAIPNAGKRHVSYAVRMRNEGLKAGVPDIFLPVAKRLKGDSFIGPDWIFGLWIEMKRQRGGTVSPEQRWWHQQLTECGYRVVVARGAKAAIDAIESYLRA